jgi:hypothetical protein
MMRYKDYADMPLASFGRPPCPDIFLHSMRGGGNRNPYTDGDPGPITDAEGI